MAILTLQRSLFAITVALGLYNFANGLVGVFVPLIMLNHGAALWQVAAFYLTYSFAKLIANYPCVLLTQRKGAYASLGLGFLAGSIQFALLLLFIRTSSLPFVFLSALALALTNGAIWNAMHIHISRVMNNTTKSSSLATMEIVNQVLGVLAPFLGGIIALHFGAGWLLVLATTSVVATVFPLLHMRRLHEPALETGTAAPVSYSMKNAPRRDVFANFCYNIETAVGVMVWPMYLALEIKTFESIGVLTALAALAASIVLLIAGHRGDKGKDREVLLHGVAASSIIDFIRIMPLNPLGITLVGIGYRSSLAYMLNAWSSTYYFHTRKHGLSYVMSMEIACDLAYIAVWLTVLLLTLLVSTHTMFIVIFVLAGIAAWGCLRISPQTKDRNPSTALHAGQNS